MDAQTAEQLIGRRAKVKDGHYRDCVGRIDQITLNYHDEPATVRLFIAPPIQDIYVSISQIEACVCGEGDGCYLCAEKPAVTEVNIREEDKTVEEKPQELPRVLSDLIGDLVGERTAGDINRMLGTKDFPRRFRMYQWTPAERAIHQALIAVEEVGADPLLTEAVVFLNQARDKVADYVDRNTDI